MEFNGRYAIVTGAASGMGRIYACRLAGMGYGLILVDINGTALQELCGSISDVPVVPVTMDLSRKEAAAEVAAVVDGIGETADGNGKTATVEVLVNNAGMLFTTPVEDTPYDKLAVMMGLHCTTPLLLCHEIVPKMKAAGKGYILNISSICAWMDWPIIGMYGNTKRFVKGFSRSLRVECAGSGVSVTTAVFGAVDTPLFGFSEKTTRRMLGTGIMISPEKAVDKALQAMFRGRKKIIPGIVNRITIALCPLVSDRLLVRLVKKYGSFFVAKR